MLAEIHYGSQRHLGYLLAANPQITDADHLLVGMVLNIPPLGAGAKKTVAPSKSNAETKPKSSDADDAEAYVVEEGDSFYAIAERVLGDSSRWNELYELNKESVGEDPGRLRVGQSLKIPKPPMPKRR